MVNKDRLIFVTLCFIAFDFDIVPYWKSRFQNLMHRPHRLLDKTNADAPTVTVNTTSVCWRSIIVSAAHALFVVMHDRLIACSAHH